MKKRFITNQTINSFKNYLIENEKATATIEKYMRDIQLFVERAIDKPLDKILITKEVYPTVAKECNTTPSKVERAIRYCVNFILEKETMDIVSPDKYGVNINGNHKLSNSKFLMILARHVLDKLAEANACDDISILNMRVN